MSGWAKPPMSSEFHFYNTNATTSICGKWVDKKSDRIEIVDGSEFNPCCKECREMLNPPEPPMPTPKDIAATDQCSAAINEHFVPAIASFYRALIREGVSEACAIKLTDTYMTILIHLPKQEKTDE